MAAVSVKRSIASNKTGGGGKIIEMWWWWWWWRENNRNVVVVVVVYSFTIHEAVLKKLECRVDVGR